ncbi:transglycosylase SLT domain-containing protein [Heyndrickxia sp. NPDC080065]|uniref:transglycosylase SLT domain-containing protein n=1 Tax=Heyndrickxia sp. NPDC080065 TaxID=3390568 RepID=UPI003D04CD10
MTELKKLNDSIPAKLKTGKFADYVLMETQYEKLNSLISKWKSDEQVPGIHDNLKSKISSISSNSDKALLQKRLTVIMDRLKITTKELKGLLTKAAREKGIPPEVVKSIAITENGNLSQFLPNGEVFKSFDNGYGIMQVTPLSDEDQSIDDWKSIKYDLSYNIQKGVEILSEKWKYSFLPKVNNGEVNILENWYFAIMAYNGLSDKINDPNKAANPYQIKVYEYMKNRTFMDPDIVKPKDAAFTVNPLHFDKMEVVTDYQTKSTQLYKKNDQITISSTANFRTIPSTVNNTPKAFPKGTKVTILDDPIEDDNPANLFIWYKVSIAGEKGTWYVASFNLK